MAITSIIPARAMSSTQTTQYTSAGFKTVVSKLTVTNTGTSNTVFNVNLVSAKDTPNSGNLIISQRTIAPKETYTCPEMVGQVIGVNGYISTSAGSSGTLTISAAGDQIA